MRHEHDAGHVKSLAFVVMPDHLHWLFSLTGSRSLSESIKNVKAFSARRINEILRSKGAIWQPAFYDRAIRRALRAGIVRTIKEYPLWDANWV
jgi:REP element-mobilizing transposase RayT